MASDSELQGNLSNVRKYVQTIGDGVSTSFTLNHGMCTRNVIVNVQRTTSPFEIIEADIFHTSLNQITVSFAKPPAINEYTVVVIG